MIIDIARGRVQAKIGDRVVTIQGEGHLRGHGSPDFILYSNSLERWDAPHENEWIGDEARAAILLGVKAEMESERGMSVEIE